MATTYSDPEIRDNALDGLRHDVRIEASNIDVTVSNGLVYLNGTIPSYYQKTVAEHDVERIRSVVEVVNNLAVTTPVVARDEEIRETIRRTINRDVRMTHPEKIRISVSNGLVTLTGTVTTYPQKMAVAQDAGTIPGVIDMANDIAILPAVTRGDAEIATDVTEALDHDPGINAARITVWVVNGTVYMRGTVPAYYQVSAASDDAWSIPGVVHVVNELGVCT